MTPVQGEDEPGVGFLALAADALDERLCFVRTQLSDL